VGGVGVAERVRSGGVVYSRVHGDGVRALLWHSLRVVASR